MTGPVPSGIDEIGLQPGSHVCAFYRGDSDRDRLLNGYLGAGLAAGDKCICIVDSAGTAERLGTLPGACGEPGPFGGQLDIHLPESTYLAGGEFTTATCSRSGPRAWSRRRSRAIPSAGWWAR